jgi:hypothetical protein
VYRPLQFQKRRQFFIRTHDKTPSVAMRVSNPDRSGRARVTNRPAIVFDCRMAK